MNRPILYCNRESGHSYKVALAWAVRGGGGWFLRGVEVAGRAVAGGLVAAGAGNRRQRAKCGQREQEERPAATLHVEVAPSARPNSKKRT